MTTPAHIRIRSIRSLFAGGLALGAATAPPALAQTAGQEGDGASLQRVEVTGSRIPGPNTEGASPVATLGARDIAIDGARSAEELLNRLPQVYAAQGSAISAGASGTATVDLRRLGSMRTLVLVDGKRLPQGSVLGTSADLNEIPVQLIRRVDVLTGGAGAVYGSGAVAGVVNFILRDDFSGVELGAGWSGANHRQHNDETQALVRTRQYPLPDNAGLDARRADLSLLAGSAFAGQAGHVTLFIGHRHADALLESARDFSACSLGPAAPGLACAGSVTSVARVGNFTPDANGNPRPFLDADAYNFGPLNHYQRPSGTTNARLALRFDLAPGTRLYSELHWHRNATDAQVAPGGIFFGQQATLAYDNPLLNGAWRAALGLTKPGDSARVFVGKRNTEGAPRNTAITDTSLRAVLGVKGQLAGWDADLFGQFARVDHDDRLTGYFSNRRIARALDVVPGPGGKAACRSALDGVDPACVPYDLYRSGGVDRAALAYLDASAASTGYTRQSILGATIGTDLGRYGLRLPGAERGIGVSFGVEQRIDALAFGPDEARRSGDLAGAGPALPVHGSTRLREAYGEFRAPLAENAWFARRLDLSGSWRRTGYITGPATSTFGLGLDWEPRAGLRLRGSAQRAVRAPNVFELYTPDAIMPNGPTSDPCGGPAPRASAAQCANTGLPAALYGKVPNNTTNQYNGRAGGNPDVRPEQADTATLGVVLEPAPGLTLTLDAFDIRIRDAIQPYNAQALFSQCLATGEPAYCQLVHRDGAGSLWLTQGGYVATGTTNIGAQGTSGLDLGAGWRVGRLSFALDGTWVRSFTVENLPGKGSYDCAGLYGATCGLPLPRWRHKVRATWSPPWSAPWKTALSLTWRYLARVKNDKLDANPQLAGPLATPRDAYLAARNYLDLNIDLSTTGARSGGAALTLGVRNLLDKDPPFASAASVTSILGNGNTYPQLYDSYGRILYLNLGWRF